MTDNCSNGDIVSLKEYLEHRINALSTELTKSERLLDHRLDGMNHLQAQMKEMGQAMATRDYLDTRFQYLSEKLQSLERSRAYTIGMAAAIAFIISIAGWVVRGMA